MIIVRIISFPVKIEAAID